MSKRSSPVKSVAFSWDALHFYRACRAPWPASYPPDWRDFFAPEDGAGIHAMLLTLIKSARRSIVLNMFGYDDDELDDAIRAHTLSPKVYVQMSLDRSQAGGVHEKQILAKWNNDAIGTSVAIGTSAKHAISHLKVLIVDGEYVVTGSTNWSIAGEEKQDNQLTVVRSAIVAATYRAVLDVNHDTMLKQMRAEAPPRRRRKAA